MIDGFFVGDGSAQLINEGMLPLFGDYSKQITKGSEVEKSFELVDDLGDFCGEVVDVSNDDVVGVWVESKRKIFEVFNYLSIKSKEYEGVPIRLEDLIYGDDDLYFVDVIKAMGLTDVYLISLIAQLYALEQMGFYEFRFYGVHDCPLCHSAHRGHFNTKVALSTLCSGDLFLHQYCDFDIIPVIKREVYTGPITDLSVDFEINGISVIGAPKEYQGEICSYLSNLESVVERIEFVNMPSYCKQNRIENAGGTVSLITDKVIYLHNSYVDNMGPLEFLSFAFSSSKEPEKISLDELKGETFFLNGNKVIKYKNHFWNPLTGERIK